MINRGEKNHTSPHTSGFVHGIDFIRNKPSTKHPAVALLNIADLATSR